jgi:ubiquinone/menaquinone biosynthesis C-methylase UbiE
LDLPNIHVNIPALIRSAMDINAKLHKFYRVARRRIVPKLRYSQDLYQEVLEMVINSESRWLDIGCGHQILPPWKLSEEQQLITNAAQVVGIDYDWRSLLKHTTIADRLQGTADALPFGNGSFNLVTANMVVEHLDNPGVQFREISRVLKPNGIFTFHTVNAVGYFAKLRRLVPAQWVKPIAKALDGRESDDVFEVQYKANSESDIVKLATESNFEIEQFRMISSDATFALVPPLAVVELFWIRLLMSSSFRRFRTNLIVVLRKKNSEI